VSFVKRILMVAFGLVVLTVPAQGAREADSRAMTIRLISTTSALEVLTDRAPKNVLSSGDVVRAKSILRNAAAQFGRPKGAIVGMDVGIVTLTSATAGDLRVTAALPGGTIRSRGRDEVANSESLRITGGTGTFAGARGVCEVRTLNVRLGRALNVYRLQLP
jgi:Dirigent-like protein